MKKEAKILLLVAFLVAASVSVYHLPSFAGEDVADLKKQIEALKEEVAQLKEERAAQQQNTQITKNKNPHLYLYQFDWDPFAEMQRMQQMMDQMFQNSFARNTQSRLGTFTNRIDFDQSIDISEKKDKYEIKFDLAGLDKDKVNIEINDNSVTFSGQYNNEHTEESPDRYFKTSSYGSFLKTIPLPEDADSSKIVTNKKDDAIIIEVPKQT